MKKFYVKFSQDPNFFENSKKKKKYIYIYQSAEILSKILLKPWFYDFRLKNLKLSNLSLFKLKSLFSSSKTSFTNEIIKDVSLCVIP